MAIETKLLILNHKISFYMMTNDYSKYDIGVIIGRFQVHELHDAHKDLIEKEEYEKEKRKYDKAKLKLKFLKEER